MSSYVLRDHTRKRKTDLFSDLCEWKALDEIDKLILDHRQILGKALETLRVQLNDQPIGYNLLPENLPCPNFRNYTKQFLEKL